MVHYDEPRCFGGNFRLLSSRSRSRSQWGLTSSGTLPNQSNNGGYLTELGYKPCFPFGWAASFFPCASRVAEKSTSWKQLKQPPLYIEAACLQLPGQSSRLIELGLWFFLFLAKALLRLKDRKATRYAPSSIGTLPQRHSSRLKERTKTYTDELTQLQNKTKKHQKKHNGKYSGRVSYRQNLPAVQNCVTHWFWPRVLLSAVCAELPQRWTRHHKASDITSNINYAPCCLRTSAYTGHIWQEFCFCLFVSLLNV